MIYIRLVSSGELLAIYQSKTNLEDNLFLENLSGGKGSAVYIRQMSDIRIYSNVFKENKPVYAGLELVYSPFTNYLSQRAMTFYDDVCVDEVNFLE
jgi:hypothetical protein